MFCPLHLLLLCWVVGAATAAGNISSSNYGGKLNDLYFEFMSNVSAFPPVDAAEVWDNPSITPIQAAFATIIVSIDDIAPQNSEFTITTRDIMYFTKNDCNQTAAHRLACDTPIDKVHFLDPLRIKGEPTVMYAYNFDEIHKSEFESLGLGDLVPSADMVQGQTVFAQQFDVKTYPYEYHYLKVQYASQFSSEILNLTMFPGIDPGILRPSVPPGWTLHDIQCNTAVGEGGRAIALFQQRIVFPTYTCNILVSRNNTGWWFTSFLLFFGLNLVSYLASLGLASHLAAEGRDDKDQVRQALFSGMRLNGVFSIGLLLTYVFQVQVAPYDQSVEFWPSVAASTQIYILGLIGIMVMSFLALLSSLLSKKHLVEDGFVGNVRKPYDIKQLPVEGEAGEDKFPLLRKYALVPRGSSVDHSPDEEEAGDEQQAAKEPLPPTRRVNMKVYPVLSLEDAKRINAIVRLDFFLRTVRTVLHCIAH